MAMKRKKYNSYIFKCLLLLSEKETMDRTCSNHGQRAVPGRGWSVIAGYEDMTGLMR